MIKKLLLAGVACVFLNTAFAENVASFKETLDLAQKGDAKVQLKVGSMYVMGDGVAQNFLEAGSWYRKSAEQGNAIAQYRLGILYYYGVGVPKDHNKALEWLKKSSDQGNTQAKNFIDRI
ncbi:sel1 repeat family protein [Acinetobacter sp. C26M]|uniref:tetratricopeptide repeat protein n=1 Tax=unclassified Acinetobacter TaxID=196816 RepID=UPI0020370DD7|nr:MULTISPECIES: tetratricopeptide repeat protein [unclassified Acinetobacter]USA46655.1 sel1 repeat family protein [Acinetobacter sp. C26M]USA50139.1 sel1 repeat family protein [Acinetobacter sp. C26G]